MGRLEPSSRCKLCSAFAASELPTAAERGLAGADAFTRNADICDACLAQDYTTETTLRRLDIGYSFVLGWTIAFIGGGLIAVAYKHELTGRLQFLPMFVRGPMSIFLVMALLVLPCTLIVWLLIKFLQGLGKWRVRDAVRKEQALNAPTDAERFYWLAHWASLTGREKFRIRMLKQAKALGFENAPPPTR